MSKAATATDLATKKNGDAILNGNGTETHDDVASVDLEGENEEEEESDEYDEDEEADYEEDRQIAGDEDDEEEEEEEEEGDEGQNALTHLLLGKPEVPVAGGDLGNEDDDEEDDEDDEYVEEPALDKSPSKKRSFDEVAEDEDSQGGKKIKA